MDDLRASLGPPRHRLTNRRLRSAAGLLLVAVFVLTAVPLASANRTVYGGYVGPGPDPMNTCWLGSSCFQLDTSHDYYADILITDLGGKEISAYYWFEYEECIYYYGCRWYYMEGWDGYFCKEIRNLPIPAFYENMRMHIEVAPFGCYSLEDQGVGTIGQVKVDFKNWWEA